nr:alpha/beta-hydrolase N-terminal domain-containing protein [Mycobacterium tuberculosis]
MTEPAAATTTNASDEPATGAEQAVDTAATPQTPEPQPIRSTWWIRHYTFTGTAMGLVFVWFSMTPSLLPRGPLFQGLVSGICGAFGYGLGVFAVWLVRYMRSHNSSPPPPRWAWPPLIAVGAVGMVGMAVQFHVWQDDVRDLMGVEHLRWYDYPLAAALSLVVLFTLVEIGQFIRWLFRFLVGQVDRIAPFRVSAAIVVVLLVVLTITLLNGVVLKFAMNSMNSTFAAVNNEMNPDSAPPKTPLRSGGPGSLVSWESLGHQGRIFVHSGPTIADLTAFNGTPAVEPIRTYAGLNSADGIMATAELAARELARTGGLRRAVVAVATSTGTGWINEAEASALEYMYNGDTAIVSMQYSFLPSWLSFLVDKENARHAGEALFEAVDKLIRQLPESQRPKLVVFGESLGSFGGEAPFMNLNNILARSGGRPGGGTPVGDPLMATSGLPPLSAVQSTSFAHLSEAAAHWRRLATRWERALAEVRDSMRRPGGTDWEGQAAARAHYRSTVDVVTIGRAVDRLHDAAAVAGRGKTSWRPTGGRCWTLSATPAGTGLPSVRITRSPTAPRVAHASSGRRVWAKPRGTPTLSGIGWARCWPPTAISRPGSAPPPKASMSWRSKTCPGSTPRPRMGCRRWISARPRHREPPGACPPATSTRSTRPIAPCCKTCWRSTAGCPTGR